MRHNFFTPCGVYTQTKGVYNRKCAYPQKKRAAYWCEKGKQMMEQKRPEQKRRMTRREWKIRRRLRLDPGARIPSDDAYIAAWLDWGFSPALIELAFDRTVLNCGRLNWKYCHGILESWRKNGLFTMADVLEKDAPPRKPETASEPDDPWRYIP